MRENGTQIYNQCGVAKYWCVAAPTIVTSTGLNGTYSSFNGTSAAAPHATGALALIMARFPYMTNEQALSVLFTTAEQIAGQMSAAPIAATGWGLPNLKNAMGGRGSCWAALTPICRRGSPIPGATTSAIRHCNSVGWRMVLSTIPG